MSLLRSYSSANIMCDWPSEDCGPLIVWYQSLCSFHLTHCLPMSHRSGSQSGFQNNGIVEAPLYLFIYLFSFLGPHLRHMEVPRLGSNWSCSCQPRPQPHQNQTTSATQATAHGNAGSLNHWLRPGIKTASSWILVKFITHWATTGTPRAPFNHPFIQQIITGYHGMVVIILGTGHNRQPLPLCNSHSVGGTTWCEQRSGSQTPKITS